MNNAAQRLLTVLEGEIKDAKGKALADLNDILEMVTQTYDLDRCDDCQEFYDRGVLNDMGRCSSCAQEQADHEADLEITSRWLDSQR